MGIKKGVYKVSVVTAAGIESNKKSFTVIVRRPKIIRISHKLIQTGLEVRIVGKNFGEFNDKSQVIFDNTEAYVYDWNDESITVEVPEINVDEKVKISQIKVKAGNGKGSNTKLIKILPAK
ncbi:MAG: hypothetical protein A2W05_01725 [Candidatus Schekmanbacteria bacterium RBG_16_38_10]|uniref:IPT/TIG domain-containing protein n=1 Tax=Candidatus Schekmanbacteria bacterium RBG_16_38_10 TaxID=1817879 RepID=A0A1F7RZP7_9BACT|nr:MAG: hypothetical protein A2W05_01725 [Candidatus Schekmanbacteria bacterium RBG_16_38_10]